MSLLKIAWRSLEQRRLSSLLTGLSIALGVALVVAVLVIYSVVENTFERSANGYNMIVGAKGGKLQLVLNTVFHLSQPIENLPWSFYKEFTDGKYSSVVEVAIPCCMGDNYKGYRVVGTTPQLFEDIEYAPGQPYEFSSGRNFESEHFFEAVIGHMVARKTGLKVGDEFEPTHGVTTEEEQGHKHDAFKVVGILAPTGTPNDRALFVNIEGFLLLEGHAKEVRGDSHEDEHASDDHEHGDDHDHAAGEHEDEHAGHDHDEEDHTDHAEEHAEHDHDEEGHDHTREEHGDHSHDDHGHEDHAHDDHDHDHGHHHHQEPLPEDQREVTAILLRTDPVRGMQLPTLVNEGQVAQIVLPIGEITKLFTGLVGPVRWLILMLAILVVIEAGIGMMVAIYNTMSERRREIAVMRALGAQRRTILTIVLLESILLSLLGGLAGLALGHGLVALASPLVVSYAGISVGAFAFDIMEVYLVPGLILLAAVVGFLPAMAAYRTDVAKTLSAAP